MIVPRRVKEVSTLCCRWNRLRFECERASEMCFPVAEIHACNVRLAS